LPEAQQDRFMLKVVIDYPGRPDELAVLDRMGGLNSNTDIAPVLTPDELEEFRQAADAVYVDGKGKNYIVDVVRATRHPDGFGLPGFGAMLFVAFFATTWWGGVRAKRIGMQPERMQDMAIVLFIAGIAGARVLYMIQYSNQFPDKSAGALAAEFFKIWKG